MRKLIKTYEESGRVFRIIQDSHGFWAIEDGMKEENINGLSGLLSDTPEEAIKKASQRVRIDILMAQGKSFIEAFTEVYKD